MIIKNFLFKKNWFFDEEFKLEKDTSFIWGVILEKNIYSGKSNFQRIDIFENKDFGKILSLDGLVQLSTKHEFVYHEMLVHPAFFYHQKPQRILIIGGGDGGVLREVVKYSVREIFLVDIDKKIIEVSKKYLPSVSGGAFNDKRLKIFCEDALKFLKRYRNSFDIIIDDLTDPTGPSAALWGAGFYRDIYHALKDRGVVAFQTAYLKDKFAKKARQKIKETFPFFKIHKAFVGCFPFDEHTFSLGSKRIDFNKISLKKIKEKSKRLNLKTKYYSPEIHFSSAVLPEYLK